MVRRAALALTLLTSLDGSFRLCIIFRMNRKLLRMLPFLLVAAVCVAIYAVGVVLAVKGSTWHFAWAFPVLGGAMVAAVLAADAGGYLN